MKAFFLPNRLARETVSAGDTGRETYIRLVTNGLDIPSDIESAVLRVNLDPVVEIELTEDSNGDFYFQWTSALFVSLPASATVYTAQVLATCADGNEVYFPTATTLGIKVNDPI